MKNSIKSLEQELVEYMVELLGMTWQLITIVTLQNSILKILKEDFWIGNIALLILDIGPASDTIDHTVLNG